MTSIATKWAVFNVRWFGSNYRMFDDETEARIAQVRYGGRLEYAVGATWIAQVKVNGDDGAEA